MEEDIEEFEVEAIRGKVKLGGEVNYLVQWAGYGQDSCTWEPASNLTNSCDAVREYEDTHECQLKPTLSPHYWPLLKRSALPTDPNDLIQVGPENWVLRSEEVNLTTYAVKVVKVMSHFFDPEVPRNLMFLVRIEGEGLPPLSFATQKDLEQLCPDLLIDYLMTCLQS